MAVTAAKAIYSLPDTTGNCTTGPWSMNPLPEPRQSPLVSSLRSSSYFQAMPASFSPPPPTPLTHTSCSQPCLLSPPPPPPPISCSQPCLLLSFPPPPPPAVLRHCLIVCSPYSCSHALLTCFLNPPPPPFPFKCFHAILICSLSPPPPPPTNCFQAKKKKQQKTTCFLPPSIPGQGRTVFKQ